MKKYLLPLLLLAILSISFSSCISTKYRNANSARQYRHERMRGTHYNRMLGKWE